MQRFTPGKVLFDERNVVLREGRADSGAKVVLAEFRARDGKAMQKFIMETDIQRRVSSRFACKLLQVDVRQEPRGTWVICQARESFYRNLALEIRIRSEKGRRWSEDELLANAKNLISALAEMQTFGAVFNRFDLKGLLMRPNGEVVLGSFEGAAFAETQSAFNSSVEKLAILLTQMLTFRSDDLSFREGQDLILRTDFSPYPRLDELMRRMRGAETFLELQKEKPHVEFGFASLPMECCPAPRPLMQSLQEQKKCLACGRAFALPGFEVTALRERYRKYSSYLQNVCSLACLDTCIQYYETERSECVVCHARLQGNSGDKFCSNACYQSYLERRVV